MNGQDAHALLWTAWSALSALMLLQFSVIGWLLRSKIKAYDEHLRECSKFPKEQIARAFDEFKDQIGKSLDDFNESFKEFNRAQNEMNSQLQQLIGRQLERDKQA